MKALEGVRSGLRYRPSPRCSGSRGAIEHHSHPGDPGFANEYRVVLPLFNLNKHIHHHEAPHCPWYLLEFRTPRPLWTLHYFTHWFRVYVWQEYVLMKPFRRR